MSIRCAERFLAFLFVSATACLNVHGQIPKGHFTDITNVGAEIDEGTFDFFPFVSADGYTLYFDTAVVSWAAERGGGLGAEDIWMASRDEIGEPFSNVVNVTELNTAHNESLGSVSSDGRTAYIGSNRSGTWELYRATRPSTDQPFDSPELASDLNSELVDNVLRTTADDRTAVLHRCDEFIGNCPHDIWITTRDAVDQPFGEPVKLGNHINQYNESFPSISADGSAIFFSDWDNEPTPRPGGYGYFDIWVTLRDDNGDYGIPVNLNDAWPGTRINTSQLEGTPFISRQWPADDSRIYFVSQAGGGFGDIYEATWVVDTIGDFSGDGLVEAVDIDLLSAAANNGSMNLAYDIDGSGAVDSADRQVLLDEILDVWMGDADLNGEFNSSDMVQVFAAGKYETGQSAGWDEGNWDADGIFDSSDMVTAFADGGYEQGPRTDAVAVPEPSGWVLLILGVGLLHIRRR